MTNAKKVAFLLADGFEDSEMANPFDEMVRNGHETVIIGLRAGEELKGKHGIAYTTHLAIDEANPDDYAAVIIPGGSSPGKLMNDERMRQFVQAADRAGATLAAICHGPQLLAAAGIVQGRTLTGYPGIARELENAGARFVDREVAVDRNLITSRRPEDEPAFIRETLERLGVNAW